MKNLSEFQVLELTTEDALLIDGGGPIREALEDGLATIGSFAHGVWDGLFGNEPAVCYDTNH
ncbi:hypothetical protein D1816_17970 [Aquimarina sp. AD10]|uniref:hypothetical protein n=1 Tax=Aquimarina sp. AD10 TaxID=1714849 RepID=UPI000E4CBEBD|nr:hypothetical protein [Aquimarina sp. AD10]AXT62165.1 hypothetical protein D1816_17970 [Aquimarina sp. AD10]RKM90640.1 hypothetical protein D7033_24410 [Aquimarina sp. AD10]